MKEKIGRYVLDAPLKADHSGFSRWGFGQCQGRGYFIKEFLSPVYPEDEEKIGTERAARMKVLCGTYERKQQQLYQKINQCSDGNLLRIHEFFRYGSKYYISTRKICALPMEEVLAAPWQDRLRLCRSLAHSLNCLHQAGLVCGDVKLDNILFHRTGAGTVAAKMTDFDNCFQESSPPEDSEEVAADLVYMAPETYLMMAGKETRLNRKLDVFAMGLVFHQLLTGRLPGFDTGEYEYPFQCVLSGKSLLLGKEIKDELYVMLSGMLQADPEKRLDMAEAFRLLGGKAAAPVPGSAPVKKDAVGFMPAGDL